MLAFTVDVPPLPQLSAPVIAYRHEAAPWPDKSWSHQFLGIRYEAGNALTTAPQSVWLRQDSLPDYRPKTELGKRLLALRRSYIANGGRLLSAEELDEELRLRRGGVGDA